jgi:trans-aconitate 2-methyltransferase
MPWDPDQYLAYADERALPFHHLVAAVAHLQPARVLDVGCGPGALTATLLERWPGAEIRGIDDSTEMIELAKRRALTDRLSFELADVMEWLPEKPIELVLSNACFHWIEDHGRLLDHLVSLMTPSATLAFQVPANHDRPSHVILAELCGSDRWRPELRGAFRVHVEKPEWYIRKLDTRGFDAITWQTTYLHHLAGDNPVLEWVKGTTLRPILDRLDEAQTAKFLAEYGTRLRKAYPERGGVTVFPFTRTFVVANR